ncbi:hypothetical protein [Pedobacter cryophilus]|uniref:DUF4386 family protein n=1 Tax=Pedobacter cryophilus TaxID=2571271 RepID=A0A4U1BWM3_9SPHI|nr:hypothetical protein [Pedobacter cryophilus]TKB96902.1 hypothetical protein FA046_12560 [Pedobacter cryophilus]
MKITLLDDDKLAQEVDEILEISRWNNLFKMAVIAAIIMAIMIPVQVLVFLVYPPPSSVEGFFRLFNENAFVGLLEYDFLMIFDMLLITFIYLALYFLLKNINESMITVALVLGLLGIASFFASNTSLEMLSLSKQFAAATTSEQRMILRAAGLALIETYNGTSFTIYYSLSAISLLVFSFAMLKNKIFTKANAYAGLITGLFMVIPPIAIIGKVGLFSSLIALLPLEIWLILFAKNLKKLNRKAFRAY